MVRLKRAFEMSILKNLTIRFNGFPETDCWVAIIKTAVAFNSMNAIYDGFYYKTDVHVISCRYNELDLQLPGGKIFTIKFGSLEEMEAFCTAISFTEGRSTPTLSTNVSSSPSSVEENK